MQNITLPKISFKQIVKSPEVYLLVVAVSIAWYFVYKFTDTSAAVIKSKDDQIAVYEKRDSIHIVNDRKKDRIIDSLQGMMLQRTDRELDQIRQWINIDTTKKSTVIIKANRK